MKKLFVLGIVTIFMAACGGGNSSESTQPGATTAESGSDASAKSGAADVSSYDPNRGTGKFTHVDIADKLDPAMAASGDKIYEVKCAGCHKLTDEKLVGPGWKGVTARQKPEWIMNFVTNTDEMITKDPKAQAMLEICLVRMPNQNLTDTDARDLLEFMRKNDGVK
ncbi:MAG TPA: c-type cytochrome [Ginsengibacter sp.]